MRQKHTKYLKFPFTFNTEKMVQDLSLVLEKNWIPHFNTNGYDGNWNVISLYAPQGDPSNIFAHTKATDMMETSVLQKCLYFKEILASFRFPIIAARILRLGVGSEIKPHRDHELGYENGNFRLHIPIITNPKVVFVLDGNPIKMNAGSCWYTNVNYVHAVHNLGSSDRVHLVIDGERNAWSDNLFFSLAPEESFGPIPAQNESTEHIKKTIEALQLSPEPIAQELIETLRKKLNTLTGVSGSE